MLHNFQPQVLHKIRIDIDKLETFFNIEDILLINSRKGVLKCYLKNGKEIVIHTTFDNLIKSLDKNIFLIIGEEYIINRTEIISIKKTETGCNIFLENNKKIQIFTTFNSITKNLTLV